MQISDLPAINASLNGTAALLLLLGYRFIRRGRKDAHRRTMLAAVAVSSLFLASYLTYHFNTQAVTRFPRDEHPSWAPVYLGILISHTILAAATLPLVIITLLNAFKQRFDRHRRIARPTFFIWLYVSVTGVLIYMMLYQWFRP